MAKVLLIDDNPEIRSLFKLLLSDYTIFEAANGHEGVEQYAKHHPDVVLTDMQIPGMDGEEVIKSIMRLDTCAKIIALTGNSELEFSELYAAGAQKVFLKHPPHKDCKQRIIDKLWNKDIQPEPIVVGPKITDFIPELNKRRK